MLLRIYDENKGFNGREGFSINKVELGTDGFWPHMVRVEARKVGANKKITVAIEQDAIWELVEMLQKRYPNACHWKTEKERVALSQKRGE